MKIFDVDVSAKHIIAEFDDTEYIIHFRDNIRKGVHDVAILKKGRKIDAKIISTYPPFTRCFREVLTIYFPLWIKSKIKEFQHTNNQ